MDSARNARTHDELLDHIHWVQQLARRLVADAHQAEDVAQESFLAVLQRHPSEPGLQEPRRFLSRVTRNQVNLGLRRRERREWRESEVARAGEVPAVGDDIERRATHARVVEAVQALPKPYREVLLLRFFDDLQPAAIATRLDIPVSTVKTRLSRAQDRLRERLSRGGDPRRWLSSLAPLLVDPVPGSTANPGPTPGAGTLVPRSALWVGAAGVFVAISTWVASQWLAPSEPMPGAHGPPTEVALRALHDSMIAGPTTEGRGALARDEAPSPPEPVRRSVSTNRDPSASSTAVPKDSVLQPGTRVSGRVLDARGQALAYPVVRLDSYAAERSSGERIAVGDELGRFHFDRHWPGGTLRVAMEGWRNLLVGETAKGDPTSEVLVVVARDGRMSGRVVDAQGRPIEGVRCHWNAPEGLRAGLGRGLGRSTTVEYATATDARGAFALGVPVLEGASVTLSAVGFVPLRVDPTTLVGTELVLERPAPGATPRAGRVVDPNGRAVPRAFVLSAGVATRCDELGMFTLPSATSETVAKNEAVIAFQPGVGAARLAGSRADGELELRLVPTRPLHGRVVDPAGRGLAGVGVWLQDPTPWPQPGDSGVSVERHLAAGSAPTPSGGTSNGPDAWSAQDGRFVLRGRLPQSYAVVARDDSCLISSRPVVLAAIDDEVTLVLDPAARIESVRGRVVDRGGRGVAAAEVRLVTSPEAGPGLSGPQVKTDADGSFLLREVPHERVQLEVSGAGLLPQRSALSRGDEALLVVDRSVPCAWSWATGCVAERAASSSRCWTARADPSTCTSSRAPTTAWIFALRWWTVARGCCV